MINTTDTAGVSDGGFADVITRIAKDPKFRECCDEAFGSIIKGFGRIVKGAATAWQENGGPEATVNEACRIMGAIKARLVK